MDLLNDDVIKHILDNLNYKDIMITTMTNKRMKSLIEDKFQHEINVLANSVKVRLPELPIFVVMDILQYLQSLPRDVEAEGGGTEEVGGYTFQLKRGNKKVLITTIGNTLTLQYMQNGVLHRENAPALMVLKDGRITKEGNYTNGVEWGNVLDAEHDISSLSHNQIRSLVNYGNPGYWDLVQLENIPEYNKYVRLQFEQAVKNAVKYGLPRIERRALIEILYHLNNYRNADPTGVKYKNSVWEKNGNIVEYERHFPTYIRSSWMISVGNGKRIYHRYNNPALEYHYLIPKHSTYVYYVRGQKNWSSDMHDYYDPVDSDDQMPEPEPGPKPGPKTGPAPEPRSKGRRPPRRRKMLDQDDE